MKRRRHLIFPFAKTFFITTTITRFAHIFHMRPLAHILLNTMRYSFNKYHVYLHGYVIMPNHIHLLLTMDDTRNISPCIGQMKSFSSKEIIKWCRVNQQYDLLDIFRLSASQYKPSHTYQVWQERFDVAVIEDDEKYHIKLNYIHSNPLQDHWNLVTTPEEYEYSSARYYLRGEKADLQITAFS